MRWLVKIHSSHERWTVRTIASFLAEYTRCKNQHVKSADLYEVCLLSYMAVLGHPCEIEELIAFTDLPTNDKPLKIKMEPKDCPIKNEHHLPKLHLLGSMFIFQGAYCTYVCI